MATRLNTAQRGQIRALARITGLPPQQLIHPDNMHDSKIVQLQDDVADALRKACTSKPRLVSMYMWYDFLLVNNVYVFYGGQEAGACAINATPYIPFVSSKPLTADIYSHKSTTTDHIHSFRGALDMLLQQTPGNQPVRRDTLTRQIELTDEALKGPVRRDGAITVYPAGDMLGMRG